MKNYKSYLRIFSFLLLSVLLSIVLISCSCSKCGQQEEAVVPLEILQKANAFITAKTGEDFFKNYISPDFYRTKFVSPYYEMVYRFFIPDKPFVDNLIHFSIDTLGNINAKREIIGIPEYLLSPESCQFNIDEERAREIAAEDKLEDGVKDWKVGFVWDVKYNRYTWHILATFYELKYDDGYKGNGRELIIAPNSGEVLARNDWKIN